MKLLFLKSDQEKSQAFSLKGFLEASCQELLDERTEEVMTRFAENVDTLDFEYGTVRRGVGEEFIACARGYGSVQATGTMLSRLRGPAPGLVSDRRGRRGEGNRLRPARTARYACHVLRLGLK